MTKRIGIGVSVAIFNEQGEVLLYKRAKPPIGHALPGGHLEFGERTLEAALREVREETGIVLADAEFVHLKEHVYEEKGEHWIMIIFAARLPAGAEPVNVEGEAVCSGLRWCSVHDLPSDMLPGDGAAVLAAHHRLDYTGI